MYRTMQYHIKPGHKLYSYCKNTCTNASKLYNRANYILRQYATAIRDFECFKPLTANQMSVFQLILMSADVSQNMPRLREEYNPVDKTHPGRDRRSIQPRKA